MPERADGPRLPPWVCAEAVLALALGLGMILLFNGWGYLTMGALVAWAIGAYVVVPVAQSPLRRVVLPGVWACCTVAIIAGLFNLTENPVQNSLVAVGSAASTALVFRLTRMRLEGPQRVILVGDRAGVDATAERLLRSSSVEIVGEHIVPTLPRQRTPEDSGNRPNGQFAAVESLVLKGNVDCVLAVPGPGLDAEGFRRLAWAMEGKRVFLGVAWMLDSVAAHRIKVGAVGGTTVLGLDPTRRSVWVRWAKSGLDRVLALFFLVLAAPLLATMWLSVRLTSSGPGFFKQVRVGRDGAPFSMFKMRTMCADAEARKAELEAENDCDGTLFKMRKDPRVTTVGRLLRRTSLDELPQLINVLRGEMSLVGPRPALPAEVETYDENARRRLAVKPGITGLWQVSGRSDLSWDESIRLDLHYADNWRLVDDLVIAARTVTAVTQARGAD